MVTIEAQLKKLQQCLGTSGGHAPNSTTAMMAATPSNTLGISTTADKLETEVICIREAETSDDFMEKSVETEKSLKKNMIDDNECTDDNNSSSTEENT